MKNINNFIVEHLEYSTFPINEKLRISSKNYKKSFLFDDYDIKNFLQYISFAYLLGILCKKIEEDSLNIYWSKKILEKYPADEYMYISTIYPITEKQYQKMTEQLKKNCKGFIKCKYVVTGDIRALTFIYDPNADIDIFDRFKK